MGMTAACGYGILSAQSLLKYGDFITENGPLSRYTKYIKGKARK